MRLCFKQQHHRTAYLWRSEVSLEDKQVLGIKLRWPWLEGLCLFPILGWWLFIISHNLESLGKEAQEGLSGSGWPVGVCMSVEPYHYHISWSGKTHLPWVDSGSEPVCAQTLTFTALCSCLWVWCDRSPGAPSSETSHNDGQQSVTWVKNTLLCLVAFVRVFDQNNKNKAVASSGHFQTCLANYPGYLYLGLDSLSFLCAASVRNTFYVG